MSRPNIRLISLVAAVALVLGAAVLFAALRRPVAKPVTRELPSVMGTTATITVYGDAHDALTDAVQDALLRTDKRLSWRIDGSDVANINAAAGKNPVTVGDDTLRILKTLRDIAQKSGNAFDPAIGPLSRAWDFGGENQRVPAKEEVARLLPLCGGTVTLDEQEKTAYLPEMGMSLDLGAAGKGAACDEAYTALKASKADGAIVSLGGSSLCLYGGKPDGKPFSVGIKNPLEPQSSPIGTLSLSAGFLSTSGTYERYFEQDSVIYHHLLDPRTGYPAKSGLLSVTVFCQSGLLSDALSTACFVLGIEKGKALLEEYNAQAVFCDEQKRVYVTEGLAQRFTLLDNTFTVVDAS